MLDVDLSVLLLEDKIRKLPAVIYNLLFIFFHGLVLKLTDSDLVLVTLEMLAFFKIQLYYVNNS